MGDFRVDQVDGLYGSDAPEDPPEATLALDTPIDYEEVRTIIAERKPGKRRIRSLIVISGLLLVFVPATLSLALNYSKTLLIVPAVIVAITVSGFMLLRSSVKLDADSPFAASRGAWHVINRVGGVFGKKFPYISPADYSQQVNEEGSLQQQADLDEYEWRLFKENKAFNSGRSVVVTVVNVKGGSSKTPISAMLAIFFGLITRRVLTAIDFNPFAGNLAVWMGIEPGRIRMRELVDRIKYAGSRLDFNKFSNGLGENDYNNQLVPSNITAERESLTVEVVNVVLGSAIGNSNHVVCDTSNNIGAPALKEILESTDVIVVAGLCKEDKLDGVVETLANFTAWDWHERVRHAVIVLTDLAPGRTVESYREEV
jgi:cellulose biosynthesis protein BcsQ